MKLNKYIDHTNLKTTATFKDIEILCQEAIKYNFASVCVLPCYVAFCHEQLKNTTIKVCTVIGFPLGANTRVVKKLELEDAILLGADEIDFVVNLTDVKNKQFDAISKEFQEIKNLISDGICKVILETCLLTDAEIIKLCQIAQKNNIDFVKTSTGFSTGGATIHAVQLMKKALNAKTEIKASGGIKNLDQAQAFIKAGATRIGTSSGVAIMTEYFQTLAK